jgi:hypothetical protein
MLREGGGCHGLGQATDPHQTIGQCGRFRVDEIEPATECGIVAEFGMCIER